MKHIESMQSTHHIVLKTITVTESFRIYIHKVQVWVLYIYRNSFCTGQIIKSRTLHSILTILLQLRTYWIGRQDYLLQCHSTHINCYKSIHTINIILNIRYLGAIRVGNQTLRYQSYTFWNARLQNTTGEIYCSAVLYKCWPDYLQSKLACMSVMTFRVIYHNPLFL